MINERNNYFHKPIVQVNSYNQVRDDMLLSTALYYSGGEGGGSGSAGSLKWKSDGSGRDYDATILRNSTENWVDGYGYQSAGVLRGSRNNQYTYGIMSKLDWDLSESTKLTFGLDVRTAEVEHYRQVYDLLGGDVYYNSSNENWTTDQEKYRTLGDKIQYDNTNTIDWQGGYTQVSYNDGSGATAFGMFGTTSASYTVQDHFQLGEPTLEADAETGWQMKVGGTYPVSDTWLLYGNFSTANLTPTLDKLVDDANFIVNTDFENEKATWFDVGARFQAPNGQWAGSLNYYSSQWSDRAQSGEVEDLSGNESFFSIVGLEENHSGLEYSIAYQPIPVLRIDARGHVSDWRFTDNLNYTYYEVSGDPSTSTNFDLYVKDVMVSGAPQEAHNLILTGFWNTMKASIEVEHFGKQYPRWGYDGAIQDLAFLLGEGNTFADDAYVTDFSTLYNLKFQYGMNLGGKDVVLNASVHNAGDELYVGDFVDAYDGSGDVANLRVRLGQPRSWVIGFTINY